MIQRAHLINCTHSVIRNADLPDYCGAHEFEKAQAGFAVRLAIKVLVLFR